MIIATYFWRLCNDMKSALQSVAFCQGDIPNGIISLLEVALEALDNEGNRLAGACVNQALISYISSLSEDLAKDAVGGVEIRKIEAFG
ncbi:hypothetical protein [Allopontixanthobacter sediminis]|uniref:Uncharacterized protein n=1 Tax=Allopontixanthobacter sediminis TaxID=1689985 RepID=A0A845B223_9SPHN|nr:hypothetical protein [Allopontixanthobacter sediminis]MXP45311.1 hypothetical protein [Allopontixanthobacter sediminis]